MVVLFRYYSIYYSGDFVLWKVVSQYYYVEVIMQCAFLVVYVEYFEVLVCSNGSVDLRVAVAEHGTDIKRFSLASVCLCICVTVCTLIQSHILVDFY